MLELFAEAASGWCTGIVVIETLGLGCESGKVQVLLSSQSSVACQLDMERAINVQLLLRAQAWMKRFSTKWKSRRNLNQAARSFFDSFTKSSETIERFLGETQTAEKVESAMEMRLSW